MVGTGVEIEAPMASNGALGREKSADLVTALSNVESFDPSAVVAEQVPPVVDSSTDDDGEKKRDIVLGKNVHTTSLEVTEPDADDESTGDKEAHMASILARYRRTLVERTKHHLGI